MTADENFPDYDPMCAECIRERERAENAEAVAEMLRGQRDVEQAEVDKLRDELKRAEARLAAVLAITAEEVALVIAENAGDVETAEDGGPAARAVLALIHKRAEQRAGKEEGNG